MAKASYDFDQLNTVIHSPYLEGDFEDISAPAKTLGWAIWVVLFLLLLNCGLFFSYRYFHANPSAVSAADAPQLAISPESIRLAAALTSAPQLAPAAEPVANAVTTSCWQWGSFAAPQAQALTQKALAAGLPAPQTKTVSVLASHSIHMGPYANQNELNRKLAELKKINVVDVAVLEGRLISLGVFSSAAAAKAQFDALGKRGVRTAKVVAKPVSLNKTQLHFKALDDTQSALLKALATDSGQVGPC